MMSKIQNMNGTHNLFQWWLGNNALFMMSKIQNLNGTHNFSWWHGGNRSLFMMSKIQNLNGTHNHRIQSSFLWCVVYDVKDTKFEWNSQHTVNGALVFNRCL